MHVFASAAEAMRTGRPSALVTVIARLGSTPRSSGARMLVYDSGDIVGTIGGGAVEHEVIRRAIVAVRTGAPERYSVHLTKDLGMCCGGRMEVFIEPLQTQEHVVVFGAGHVGAAVAPLLHQLNYRVTVVDERDEWLTADRFAAAERIVGDPRSICEALPPDPRGIRLVLTHDHGLDEDLVDVLLRQNNDWVGMIGSRAKAARFRARLIAGGMSEDTFARLKSPVGLDIGAETPAEIAVSIAGALVAHRRQRVD